MKYASLDGSFVCLQGGYTTRLRFSFTEVVTCSANLRMLEEYDCLRVQYDHIKSEHDHFKSECERFRDEHHDLKVQCDLMRNQVETLDFKQQQLDAARCQNEQMRLNLKTAQERLTALQLYAHFTSASLVAWVMLSASEVAGDPCEFLVAHGSAIFGTP